MNIRKLKEAEAFFLQRYPDGFQDDGLAQVRKSHNVDALAKFTQENLTRTTLGQPNKFAEVLLKIISRSSMVSRFEKPSFRQFIESLNTGDRARLADAFEMRLFGRNKQRGFDEIVDMLAYHKIARWSVVSAVPFYFAPTREAFVKPTTAKRIVQYLEVDDLHYHAKPDWAFYDGYRKLIEQVRKQVTQSLSPNNAALTGFLMTSM